MTAERAPAPRPSAGLVVWVTGLPQSGKTTFAEAFTERARRGGWTTVLLDGDCVREVLKPSPGYDEASRADFYASLAGLARLLSEQGLWVVVPATAHLRAYREAAREQARGRFVEVFLDVPLPTAHSRDRKGLYEAAYREGSSCLPGEGVPYERPLRPDVVAHGGWDVDAVERAVTMAIRVARVGAPPDTR